jgi:hypothetical protein
MHEPLTPRPRGRLMPPSEPGQRTRRRASKKKRPARLSKPLTHHGRRIVGEFFGLDRQFVKRGGQALGGKARVSDTATAPVRGSAEARTRLPAHGSILISSNMTFCLTSHKEASRRIRQDFRLVIASNGAPKPGIRSRLDLAGHWSRQRGFGRERSRSPASAATA